MTDSDVLRQSSEHNIYHPALPTLSTTGSYLLLMDPSDQSSDDSYNQYNALTTLGILLAVQFLEKPPSTKLMHVSTVESLNDKQFKWPLSYSRIPPSRE